MSKNDKSQSLIEEKKSEKFTFSANPKSSGDSSSEEIKFIEDKDSSKKKKFIFNKNAKNESPTAEVKKSKKFTFSADSEEEFFDLSPIPSSSTQNSSNVKTNLNYDEDSSQKRKFTFNKNTKSESPKQEKKAKKFTYSANSEVGSYKDNSKFTEKRKSTMADVAKICPLCNENFGSDDDRLIEHAATCNGMIFKGQLKSKLNHFGFY